MTQDNGKRKKILGAILAIFIFVLWTVIDLYMLPIIGLDYSFWEFPIYISWALISIVCFGVLFWTGWFPMRQDESLE